MNMQTEEHARFFDATRRFTPNQCRILNALMDRYVALRDAGQNGRMTAAVTQRYAATFGCRQPEAEEALAYIYTYWTDHGELPWTFIALAD